MMFRGDDAYCQVSTVIGDNNDLEQDRMILSKLVQNWSVVNPPSFRHQLPSRPDYQRRIDCLQLIVLLSFSSTTQASRPSIHGVAPQRPRRAIQNSIQAAAHCACRKLLEKAASSRVGELAQMRNSSRAVASRAPREPCDSVQPRTCGC